MNQLLTTFIRNDVNFSADFGEEIGNMSLGLLRIGFGKTVNIEKIPEGAATIQFNNKVYSTSVRVVAVVLSLALSIIAFPFTILVVGIGSIGVAYSKSHRQMFNSYSHPASRALPQVRKIPPVGLMERAEHKWDSKESRYISVPASQFEFFSDDAIVTKPDIFKKTPISPSVIYALYTQNQKAIIQQQGTKGSAAAVALMLIMDNQIMHKATCLRSSYNGNDDDIRREIQNSGLRPITNHANNLSELRQLILNHGSCIICLSAKSRHYIVVDEISENLSNIRLRDPYHGWEITVTQEGFLKEWNGSQVIQAQRAR